MKPLSFATLTLCLLAGAASAADAPKAAVDTCLKHADAYTNAAAGTAKFTGNVKDSVPWLDGQGNNLQLVVDAGGMALNCTVSPDGKLVALAPAAG